MSKKTTIPPCPYCADPALLDAPKGKGGPELSVSPGDWRIWRGGAPYLEAKIYGPRFVAVVPAKHLAEKFAGFSARLVGVNVGLGFNSTAAPPMFDYQILGAIDSIVEGSNLFSAWVVEDGEVETRAHWWPTHETIINQRLALSAKDPAGRNAELEAARLALSFFELETRGAPKLTTVEVVQAVQRLGDKATLARVAEELKVGERTLHDWRRRQKLTWAQVKDRFMNATVS
jgi:hypothetical protein